MQTTKSQTNAAREAGQTQAPTQELAIRIGRSNHIHQVASFEEAVAIWEQYRDENGLGASESPKVTVIELLGFKTVATISYNGRVWDTGGEEIALGDRKTAAQHDAEGWRDFL
jgi:hypothetical protein